MERNCNRTVNVARLVLAMPLVLVSWSSTGNAAEVRQLSRTPATSVVGTPPTEFLAVPAKMGVLDAGGTAVYINVNVNPFGQNAALTYQIFKFNAAAAGGAQITHLADGVGAGPYSVAVSDDGAWLAFLASGDPLGQNHNRNPEVFVIRTDETSLAQLTNDATPNAGSATMLALAGGGSRVAFVANSDLVGANAARVEQLFVVNRDGTGLAQLTSSAGGEFRSVAISDNGQRIVFCHEGDLLGTNADGTYEVFAIGSDGTNLRQLTTSPTADVQQAAISGNGAKIVFDSTGNYTGGNADGGSEIFSADWTTGALFQVTVSAAGSEATLPAISDDASLVFYSSNETTNHQIWKINANGTGATVLTSVGPDTSDIPVSVSGNGQRVVYRFGSDVLRSITASGTQPFLLVDADPRRSFWPDISADGSRVVLVSDSDLIGGSPAWSFRLYRVQSDGTGLALITGSMFAYDPSISGDGTRVAFVSSSNPTGQNPGFRDEVFRIQADGSGVQQLTHTSSHDPGYARAPTISDDGSRVAFTSRADLLGQFQEPYSAAIYCIRSDGTQLALLSPNVTSYGGTAWQHIDATGNWVVFASNDDLITGSNADESYEIFRAHCDGTGLEQLTSSPTYEVYSQYPDVSGNGTRIVWESNGDPLGQNPEHNGEIFLWDAGTLRQLTATDDGDAYAPRISGDGAWVYFNSEAQPFEADPDERHDLLRVHVATGTLERASGLPFGNVAVNSNTSQPIAVNGDGSRAVFAGVGNFTGGNPDLLTDVWIVDQNGPQPITVSGAAPTRLSWLPEPKPVRYDVIRGSVASLQFSGPSVALGPVVCLEDDSPDSDTTGFEDAADPAPGQAFFYVFRGTQGLDDGPGSYGQSTSGAERVPLSGGCTQ